MMDWQQATPLLTAKLDRADVKERKQGGGTVSYIEGWHAIAEMNRIFGFGAWDRETVDLRQLGSPRDTDGKTRVDYMARVRVTVFLDGARPVIREGCGFGQGIDRDVGQAHESALKEAETDAMKRAMMTFGNPFGLALYDKSRENVGTNTPPFDAAGCEARLMTGIGNRKTKQDLSEYWRNEEQALAALKAANAEAYQRVRAAFAEAGKKATDDPARQAPPQDQKDAA